MWSNAYAPNTLVGFSFRVEKRAPPVVVINGFTSNASVLNSVNLPNNPTAIALIASPSTPYASVGLYGIAYIVGTGNFTTGTNYFYQYTANADYYT
jgi:hypothetical protein